MTDEQRQAVFTRPQTPRFRWKVRRDILAPLLTEPGAVESVQVVLEGRPEEVREYDEVVLLKMSRSGAQPPTPKGVPQPQLLPGQYTVLIRREQWRKVTSKLGRAQTVLVVEGVCAIDAEIGGLVVCDAKVISPSGKSEYSLRYQFPHRLALSRLFDHSKSKIP